MKLLVKIYEHQFVRNIITQEIIDSQVIIEEDLGTFTICNFQLPLVSIQEDNYIEVYEINNTDVLQFSWFVWKVTPIWKQFGFINIECRGEKAQMQKRLALKTKASYNVKSVTSLPVRPAPAEFGVNYWVNNSISSVIYLLWVIVPEPPESWPTPDPYYDWAWISFVDTVFLVDTDNEEVKRIENWQILDEWTGTGVDINWILDDLIDDYSSLYNEDWTYETDFNQNISLNIKKWDNYFDVLDELAQQTESTRDIKNSKIIFTKYANDKTTGEDFQEILYNWLYPNTSNISNIEVIGTATRCNIVMWQDTQWNIMVNDSAYVDRIYGVWKEEFRDWDMYEKLNKYLLNINKSQRLYKVQVESNTINANIGDKIKLTVENTNSYFDIDTDVLVLNKTTTYNNGSKNVSYAVWELNLDVSTASNWLYGVQKSIKLLKIK